MSSAHNRYNLLFRQTHETRMIHHFALLLFKNYLTIQVGTLQRIHRQYIRYDSVLDDTLIGIDNLNSGYLTHLTQEINKNFQNIYFMHKCGKSCWFYSPMWPLHVTLY